MVMAAREVRNVSLVVEGAFNPLIVQPDWLLAQGLIDQKDRETVLDSKEMMVTPEFVAARFPWLVIEVARDSVYLSTTRESETPDRVRQLAIGMFSSLPHTPITSINVMYNWHLDVDPDRWAELIDAVAPPTRFAELLGQVEFDTLRQQATYEDHRAAITLQPSRLDGYVAFLQVDSEWPVPEDLAQNAEHALFLLDRYWDDVRSNAQNVRDALFEA